MLLSIRHETNYTYDQPILLEPHTLRLTPRADSYSSLVERKLTIFPEPAGMSLNLEQDGSFSHLVWFSGETKLLSIRSKVVIELHDANPFVFIVSPMSCLFLPMIYPSQLAEALLPFRTEDTTNAAVHHFACRIMDESQGKTLDFLTNLCRTMKEEFIYEKRELGDPYPAHQTLADKRGSCRDWAVLFMSVVRAVGLACRFVSGYLFDEFAQDHELHAWVEVYIPGAGWRGFDPTIGMACYGRHIALTACAFASMTLPVKGYYRGTAISYLETRLEFRLVDELPESFPEIRAGVDQ